MNIIDYNWFSFYYFTGDGSHPIFGHHMSEVPPPDEIQDHVKQS